MVKKLVDLKFYKYLLLNSRIHLLRFYKNLPIRRKLLLILNIQIIIPLILIGYMSYKNSAEIIQNKSMGFSQDILKMIELRLKDYVNNLTVISQDLQYDKKIYSVLNSSGSNENTLQSYEDRNEIDNILKKVILSRDEIQSICIMSNNMLDVYKRDKDSKKVNITDAITRAKYQEILKKARVADGKPVWYMDVIDRNVKNVFMARVIYNQNNFQEIGLLVILINKDFLDTVYHDLINEDMENIEIITVNNERVVSRNPGNTYLMFKDVNQFMKGEIGSQVDDKTNTLISFVSVEEPGWKVVTYIPLKNLHKEIDLLRQQIIVLCLISVMILSTLSIFIAFDFINPINRIVKGMEKVQKGENSVYIEDDRKDELGFLNTTFNKMAKEINHLVNWIYREQITRKDAELKALQSQINPHFLFNTLESINWMAHLNNVPEISETVTALSSLMEASIGRDDRLITIDEEFRYIDNYIVILKKRFEDKIELQKTVQPEISNIKIPRLLIQPLIENAVYHGIEKIREKGVIRLKAYSSGDIVRIEVEDNGLGIDKDDLYIINERLSMDNDTYFRKLDSKKTKSIGIENVNRRIKLFYGEQYGLMIESEPGAFTKVIVTIPLNSNGSKEVLHVQGFDN